ncbi:MAG: class I SAM-dependent methyltransferase [Planctomycetota bacterium]
MTNARCAHLLALAAAFASCQGANPTATSPTAATVPARDEASVKPGINKDFLDPKLEVKKYEERFEGESREIFVHRARIAALLDLQPGRVVADVGAGTGLYTRMFAQKLGNETAVYAVDIAKQFVDHVVQDAHTRGLLNVVGVVCTERSVELPKASVDVVFVCDTYHHFEYPKQTLASIRDSLRPGGDLFVVDFIRIPGTSREWILEHVRAGQDVVTQEIEAAGFVKVRDEATPFLKENYAMRFKRT